MYPTISHHISHIPPYPAISRHIPPYPAHGPDPNLGVISLLINEGNSREYRDTSHILKILFLSIYRHVSDCHARLLFHQLRYTHLSDTVLSALLVVRTAASLTEHIKSTSNTPLTTAVLPVRMRAFTITSVSASVLGGPSRGRGLMVMGREPGRRAGQGSGEHASAPPRQHSSASIQRAGRLCCTGLLSFYPSILPRWADVRRLLTDHVTL